MKFTIIYERLVRVREYETLKIGLWREFDLVLIGENEAFVRVAELVDKEIENALVRLREKGPSST